LELSIAGIERLHAANRVRSRPLMRWHVLAAAMVSGERQTHVAEQRRQQDAVASANTIIAKAREAAELEKEQLMSQLKREFGRMVSDATSRVTGKVLNNDDQSRINQETATQVSA
jgi:F-type H+-transporting ATPase subunit b